MTVSVALREEIKNLLAFCMDFLLAKLGITTHHHIRLINEHMGPMYCRFSCKTPSIHSFLQSVCAVGRNKADYRFFSEITSKKFSNFFGNYIKKIFKKFIAVLIIIVEIMGTFRESKLQWTMKLSVHDCSSTSTKLRVFTGYSARSQRMY